MQTGEQTTTPPVTESDTAGAEEIAALEKLYEGRVAYYGDLHVHTQSGEKSDGKLPLEDWPEAMAENKVDFVAVADPNAKFYRVEIYDTDTDLLIGLGNPIWNAAK